jgi:hypothetical protein
MSDVTAQTDPLDQPNREEVQAALFADLVVRQASLAMMFLGQAPQPHSRERKVDLEAAQMFIDQLEMLEEKTRGRLSKIEEQLLKQTLTQLRMTFVEVSAHPPATSPPGAPAAPSPAAPTPPQPSAPAQTASAPPATPSEEEQKVKYSKKY